MNHIYHEKQDGALCGQHCINNLLQHEYFTAVDLATIAQQMDHEEKSCMAESGVDSSEFQKFLEQPSSNMDDSGMFSIQVLTAALKNMELALVNFSSTHSLAILAQNSPNDLKAYICNFREHWFTIRKIGKQWFNLNSLLTFPELISDTYLSLFLTQLQHEGYSIFVVEGELPECEANHILNLCPVTQEIKPLLITANDQLSKNKETEDLEAALKASLANIDRTKSVEKTSSQKDLDAAILMSLSQTEDNSDDDEDYQKAKLLSLGASCPTSSHQGTSQSDPELEKALQLSLDSVLCDVKVPENPLEPDLEEIRLKRLKKLEKK